MTMKTYARIHDGRVAELFATDGNIAELFHPALVWVECGSDVQVGWLYDSGVFSEPPQPEPVEPAPVVPPLDKLKAFLSSNPDVVAAIESAST